MNSFTRKLIVTSTGVVFISFVVVSLLFNVLVSRYIRAEAERELLGSINDVIELSTPIRVQSFGPLGSLGVEFRAAQEGHFQTFVAPRLTEGFNIIPGTNSNILDTTIYVTTMRPTRQTSIVNTDMIAIRNTGEIVLPRLEELHPMRISEVEFLANYYLQNQQRIQSNQLTRVVGAEGVYYVTAIMETTHHNTMSIIMYTDISQAMVFTNTMNGILALLLAVSALFTIVISSIMSGRFRRAITRLSHHAQTIGQGHFGQKAGAFKDSEFNHLANSMDNMAAMLQAYENNQKQFFQNASHELRTPLMSIQGYAEGLLGDVFDKDEAAGVILSEGAKMTELVKELLFISRIDSNQEAPTAPVNLQNLLAECCESMLPIATKNGKTLDLSTAHISVHANEEQLARAVTNILSNAIRHAASAITITCTQDQTHVHMSITDDGQGILDKDLPYIFDRFYKGENGNYGLGLAICRDIVKNMGGDITAGNVAPPNTGACFVISFPYRN